MAMSKDQKKKLESTTSRATNLDQLKPMKRDSKGAETLKPAKKAPAPQPNKLESFIQDVTNRYRVTAREARDIVTAAGTVIKSTKDGAIGDFAKANLKNQIKEVGTAATKGKKGTPSAESTNSGRGIQFKGPRS